MITSGAQQEPLNCYKIKQIFLLVFYMNKLKSIWDGVGRNAGQIQIIIALIAFALAIVAYNGLNEQLRARDFELKQSLIMKLYEHKKLMLESKRDVEILLDTDLQKIRKQIERYEPSDYRNNSLKALDKIENIMETHPDIFNNLMKNMDKLIADVKNERLRTDELEELLNKNFELTQALQENKDAFLYLKRNVNMALESN